MLTEKQGTAILKELFEAAGYKIAENVNFEEGGVRFEADGWDQQTRVGYEYMTLGERDHEDLSPDDLLSLQTWTEQGKLHFLFVDETEVADAEALRAMASEFLKAVAERKQRSSN